MGGVREQKDSPTGAGMSDSGGHLFAGARRAVVLVRFGGVLGGDGSQLREAVKGLVARMKPTSAAAPLWGVVNNL